MKTECMSRLPNESCVLLKRRSSRADVGLCGFATQRLADVPIAKCTPLLARSVKTKPRENKIIKHFELRKYFVFHCCLFHTPLISRLSASDHVEATGAVKCHLESFHDC